MRLFGKRRAADGPSRSPRTNADAAGYVFRRSRTLTGTTSAKVTAGAQQRSQLKTVRLQVHELHLLRKRILRILLVVGLVIVGTAYLVACYIGAVAIRYAQPGGSPPTERYVESVQRYFVQHPLERFGFAINRTQLATELQAAHPELLSVDIDKQWYGGGVAFVLQFRRPVLVWATGGRQFYVDGQGVAFSYDHLKGTYVAVNDESGIPPEASGGSVASNRFINFLGKMVGAVNAGGRGAVTDIIIPGATREVNLKVQGRGYPIKTHTDRDPLQQAQDVVNALKWMDDKKLTPEYIDVRVEGKAYFK